MRANASCRDARPPRIDLISEPVSTIPHSNRSKIVKLCRARRFEATVFSPSADIRLDVEETPHPDGSGDDRHHEAHAEQDRYDEKDVTRLDQWDEPQLPAEA